MVSNQHVRQSEKRRVPLCRLLDRAKLGSAEFADWRRTNLDAIALEVAGPAPNDATVYDNRRAEDTMTRSGVPSICGVE